jgi:putative ABC transport system substrate-binding protein
VSIFIGRGAPLQAMGRRAAFQLAEFSGVRPSELPVEKPTKFELIINLKTAKRSASRSQNHSYLLRADQVIE